MAPVCVCEYHLTNNYRVVLYKYVTFIVCLSEVFHTYLHSREYWKNKYIFVKLNIVFKFLITKINFRTRLINLVSAFFKMNSTFSSSVYLQMCQFSFARQHSPKVPSSVKLRNRLAVDEQVFQRIFLPNLHLLPQTIFWLNHRRDLLKK